MRFRSMTLLAVLALALPVVPALSAEEKAPAPTLVVRVNSIDGLIGDLRFLAGEAGLDEEAKGAEGILRTLIRGKGLEGFDTTKPIGVDTQPTPRSWYAAGKLFLEGAGRGFAEKFGLSVLAVRLGWCPRTKEQVAEISDCVDWAQDVYLSPDDAGRFFADATEAAGPNGYAVVYATSKPVKWARYDMEPTRRITGFEPRQRWPEGSEIVLAGK